jgi:hypothetical protein
MAEWLKAHAWKACVRETVPWVRIPLSPPVKEFSYFLTSRQGGFLRHRANPKSPFGFFPGLVPFYSAMRIHYRRTSAGGTDSIVTHLARGPCERDHMPSKNWQLSLRELGRISAFSFFDWKTSERRLAADIETAPVH